jgi:biopolymer transport protein ExbB
MRLAAQCPVLLAQEPAAGGATTSLFEYVKAGGPLGYLLIGLSVIVVALVVRNLLALRRSLLAPPELAASLSQRLRAGQVQAAAKACQEDEGHSFLAAVMASAIRRCTASPMGALEARAAVEESGQVEASKLHRMNNGLGVLAAVGPMLGLLGTVIGMIGAFNAIGSLQGAARSTELARFMSLALVNTAQGLVVAVPATVAFALFRQRIDRVVTDIATDVLEPLADDLSAGLAAGQRAAGAQRAAAAPQQPAPAAGTRGA